MRDGMLFGVLFRPTRLADPLASAGVSVSLPMESAQGLPLECMQYTDETCLTIPDIKGGVAWYV